MAYITVQANDNTLILRVNTEMLDLESNQGTERLWDMVLDAVLAAIELENGKSHPQP